jgi:hypothetical protein
LLNAIAICLGYIFVLVIDSCTIYSVGNHLATTCLYNGILANRFAFNDLRKRDYYRFLDWMPQEVSLGLTWGSRSFIGFNYCKFLLTSQGEVSACDSSACVGQVCSVFENSWRRNSANTCPRRMCLPRVIPLLRSPSLRYSLWPT